jgi:hypothetical protein
LYFPAPDAGRTHLAEHPIFDRENLKNPLNSLLNKPLKVGARGKKAAEGIDPPPPGLDVI